MQSSIHSIKTHQIAYQDGYVSWHEFGVADANTPPLVLLHGGHGSWEHWAKNLERLAEHFQVFIPDMPGFGDSSFFSGELQSGILDPLLASLDFLFGSDETINIAGFSFGGFVAASVATQYPVAQLITVAPQASRFVSSAFASPIAAISPLKREI